jgi:long-chain acyl-CoA synthetase
MKLAISFFQYFTILVERFIFKLFAGLRVEGRQFLEVLNGPVIFIANHRSMLDPYVLTAAIPFKHHRYVLPFRFATKVTYLNNPLLKPFLTLWGCFPVAPRSGSIEEVLAPALDVTRDREQSMVYFPEGKVIKEEGLHQARPGIAYLTKRSGWLIVPVGLLGLRETTWLRFLSFRNHYTVRFGQPFYYHEVAAKDDELTDAAQKIMGRVNKLLVRDTLAFPKRIPAATSI